MLNTVRRVTIELAYEKKKIKKRKSRWETTIYRLKWRIESESRQAIWTPVKKKEWKTLENSLAV